MSYFPLSLIGGSANKEWTWFYTDGAIVGHSDMKFNGVLREKKRGPERARFSVKDAEQIEIVDQGNTVRLKGAAKWGVVGALIAGPAAGIVGGLLGGRTEEVTFLAKFPDGTSMLAQAPKATWFKIYADRI